MGATTKSEIAFAQTYKEHIENNLAVRKILHDRSVKPEQLPLADDVKKAERRLESEEKIF